MSGQRAKLGAELLGTFALVFVGAGAVIVESHTGMSHLGQPDGKVGLIGIALAHGLILSAMIYAVGGISGAHINPAVSLAMWLRQRLPGEVLFGYMGAQLAGALLAALCLAGFFPDEVALASLGTPSLAPHISVPKGIMFEGVITFLLTAVILFATARGNENRSFAGLVIGGTLAALILVVGPLTGAAANPVRYLGPAIVSGQVNEILVYLVGPFAGGGAAAFVYGLLESLRGGEEPEDSGARWVEEDEPMPPLGDDPWVTVQHAYDLYSHGLVDEAEAEVLPLLTGGEVHSRQVMDGARSLLIILEQEHGRRASIDPHPARIHPTDMGASH